MQYLTTRSEVLAFSINTLVVIDVVLPAMLGPSEAISFPCLRSNSCRRTYWFWCGNLASKPSVWWMYKSKVCERSFPTKTWSQEAKRSGLEERIPAGRGLVLAYVRWYRGMFTCNELKGLGHKFIIARHGESLGLGYFWFFPFSELSLVRVIWHRFRYIRIRTRWLS